MTAQDVDRTSSEDTAATTVAGPVTLPEPPKRDFRGDRVPGDKALSAQPSTWVAWAGVAAFLVLLLGSSPAS